MEESQTECKASEQIPFRAGREEGVVRKGVRVVRPQEIRSYAFRGLVRHLHTVLQHGYREHIYGIVQVYGYRVGVKVVWVVGGAGRDYLEF